MEKALIGEFYLTIRLRVSLKKFQHVITREVGIEDRKAYQ